MTRAQFLRERINAAMIECHGDRKLASQMLDMPLSRLNIKLNTCAILKARWSVKRHGPPKPIDTVNRDLVNQRSINMHREKVVSMPGMQQLNTTDVELASQMAREDSKVRAGLTAMGMSDEEVEIARGCQKFGASFYMESLQIIGGGATKTAVLIQKQISRIDKRLEDVRTKLMVNDPAQDGAKPEERQAWVNEEMGLMTSFTIMSSEARRMMEMGHKTLLIRATIEKSNVERMKRAKPGFQPDVRDEGQA